MDSNWQRSSVRTTPYEAAAAAAAEELWACAEVRLPLLLRFKGASGGEQASMTQRKICC